jgi:hypothetical protein
MQEKIIQKSIIDYLSLLENLGKLYFFRANSGAVKLESGRFMKTGKAGCPDIICCVGGKFIGLEVKNEKGKQSPTQKDTEEKIKKVGGEYYVVRSVDDVGLILNNNNL